MSYGFELPDGWAVTSVACGQTEDEPTRYYVQIVCRWPSVGPTEGYGKSHRVWTHDDLASADAQYRTFLAKYCP